MKYKHCYEKKQNNNKQPRVLKDFLSISFLKTQNREAQCCIIVFYNSKIGVYCWETKSACKQRFKTIIECMDSQ